MVINFEITRIANVSKEVCLWNTWDHEHLYFVHKQFGGSKILFENKDVAIIQTKMKIPFFPLYFNSIHTLINVENNNVKVIDTMPFGIISELFMEYIPIQKNQCKLVNHYKMTLPIILFPLKKIIPFFIKKWNKINWDEDLPLKTRRMQALTFGFRDFHGIPRESKDFQKKESTSIKLPLPRLKDSIIN